MNSSYQPIGPFERPGEVSPEQRAETIRRIGELPAQLRTAIERIPPDYLEASYRPGGWTARQLLHHLIDADINAYVRTRLTLTEDNPAVMLFDENAWAALDDARSAEPEPSLRAVEGLRARWVRLLQSLPPEAFARTMRHPKYGQLRLEDLVAMYDWHGRHHLGQIEMAANAPVFP